MTGMLMRFADSWSLEGALLHMSREEGSQAKPGTWSAGQASEVKLNPQRRKILDPGSTDGG